MAQTTRTPRASHASPRFEVKISVYDLLPPGKLTSILWTFGTSLLHTGVSIGDREYAFGGHDRKGVTGVYWTKPHTEPPGGTFRCEILHGIAVATPADIDAIVRKVRAAPPPPPAPFTADASAARPRSSSWDRHTTCSRATATTSRRTWSRR